MLDSLALRPIGSLEAVRDALEQLTARDPAGRGEVITRLEHIPAGDHLAPPCGITSSKLLKGVANGFKRTNRSQSQGIEHRLSFAFCSLKLTWRSARRKREVSWNS